MWSLQALEHTCGYDDTIKIIQDFNGSWELYMYCCENNDYFAISNSYIKLLEYLKGKTRLTINKDYANSFLFIDLTSYFYEDTLINEIKYVPRNCEIIIDKKSKTISYNEIDYEENSIDLNSEKGLKTLDSWFEKWVSIVRLIKSKTNNISFDLTGGFDSRVVATIWLSANLNFDKLYVNTMVGTSKQFIRDLKVSSEISNGLKFPLNKNTIASSEKEFDDIFTLILISFYIKLGFHKKIFFKNYQHDEPIYSMSGDGGASVKGYANKTCSEFIDGRIYFLKDKGEEVCDSSNRIFHESFSKLLEKFPNVYRNSKDLPRLLYNEVRLRHHIGKGHIERYFNNKFVLSPLLDPELRKLKLTADECGDRNLLYALIFTRYYPELLNFDFEKIKKLMKTL